MRMPLISSGAVPGWAGEHSLTAGRGLGGVGRAWGGERGERVVDGGGARAVHEGPERRGPPAAGLRDGVVARASGRVEVLECHGRERRLNHRRAPEAGPLGLAQGRLGRIALSTAHSLVNWTGPQGQDAASATRLLCMLYLVYTVGTRRLSSSRQKHREQPGNPALCCSRGHVRRLLRHSAASR